MRRVLWWAALLGGLLVLHEAGRGALAVAAPWRLSTLGTLVQSDGVALAAFALLRLAVIGCGCYLVVLGLLAEATRLPGVGRLVLPLVRLPWPGGRSLVWRAVGVTWLAGSAAVGSVAAAAPAPTAGPGGSAAPVMHLLGPASSAPAGVQAPAPPNPSAPNPSAPATDAPAPSSTAPPSTAPSQQVTAAAPTTTAPQAALPPTAPVMSALPPGGGAPDVGPPPSSDGPPPATPSPLGETTGTAGPTSAGAPSGGTAPTTTPVVTTPVAGTPTTAAPAAVPSAPGAAAGEGLAAPAPLGPAAVIVVPDPGGPGNGEVAPATYVLQSGDHLWSVAERTLTAALGHPPDEATLGQYWWQVVEANRDRLPSPADPDYVLPGFVVDLPPLPA